MARQSKPWLLVCALAGCQVLPGKAPDVAPSSSEAEVLWSRGQAAMHRGEHAEAISCYEQSISIDPRYGRPHLSLAASYLASNNQEKAASHLGQYLRTQPQQVLIRLRYGDLLRKLGRQTQAAEEYRTCIEIAEQKGGTAIEAILPAHSRLVELAEAAADEYAEHLHRGIGLYLLAQKRADLGPDMPEIPAQGLLCKAAAELAQANAAKPGEARPCWYLHLCWSKLGQEGPARHYFLEASKLAPFSYLTQGEELSLRLQEHRLRSDA